MACYQTMKRETFLFVCCYLFYLTVAAPEYQFSFGRTSGVDSSAEDTGKPYYAYYGIPFAQAPVGGLRFRAPQPFRGNNPNRVISSTSFRPSCIQVPYPGIQEITSEDCLFLNVFTPTDVNNGNVNSGGALKKVMVWIHGGGFIQGSTKAYMPSRLVTDHDVIVVTIQYRLGLFGFLNPGNKLEANFGLRDQIMAIQWVKDNIRQFGGDGNDITIFGESAGSSSVALVSLSPLSKGLFNKAIMQSGAATNPWAINKRPDGQFVKIADNLGCLSWLQQFSMVREQSMDTIMECMRTKTADQVLNSPFKNDDKDDDHKSNNNDNSDDAQSDLEKDFSSFMATMQAPSVDGVVIPRDPESLLADRKYLQANGVLDRSYIVGFNNMEGLQPEYKSLIGPPKIAESFVKTIAKMRYPGQQVSDDIMDFVVYEYTYPRGDKGIPDIMNVLSAYSDIFFSVDSVKFARALASISDTTPVYFYLLDHYPELVDPNLPIKGSIHSLDLVYEFDRSADIENYSSFYAKLHTPTDRPLYNIIRNSFTNFAKTGVPTSQEYRSWPRFRLQDQSYMALAPTCEVRQRVFAKRIDLWTDVLPKRTSMGFRSRPIRLY